MQQRVSVRILIKSKFFLSQIMSYVIATFSFSSPIRSCSQVPSCTSAEKRCTHCQWADLSNRTKFYVMRAVRRCARGISGSVSSLPDRALGTLSPKALESNLILFKLTSFTGFFVRLRLLLKSSIVDIRRWRGIAPANIPKNCAKNNGSYNNTCDIGHRTRMTFRIGKRVLATLLRDWTPTRMTFSFGKRFLVTPLRDRRQDALLFFRRCLMVDFDSLHFKEECMFQYSTAIVRDPFTQRNINRARPLRTLPLPVLAPSPYTFHSASPGQGTGEIQS